MLVVLVPMVVRNNSRVRGVQWRPWVEQDGDHPHVAHILWLANHPNTVAPARGLEGPVC